jgi:hypothetical protein
MYSKKAWGGNVDPHIIVLFTKPENSINPDPVVSLIVYEWTDFNLIGVQPPDGSPVCVLMC